MLNALAQGVLRLHPMRASSEPWNRAAVIQGAFYVASGLWPILHYRSFEAVTGPKVDRWLVKTVAGLITAVGVSLLAGRRERPRARRVLGVGSASSSGSRT
ncbi:MAG: hypothetical protein WKG01_40120 [Kofleriaceae bacterium]